jgi:flagellar hook-associated protein 2
MINAIMDAEKVPINDLKTRQTELNAKKAAMQEMNTRLQALRGKAAALDSTSLFTDASAVSSDSTVVTASGGASAVAGTYQVTVQKLAQAHQIRFDGYADTDTSRVGTGTLTLQVGSGAATTININSSNNTLSGLRDAINGSNAGVTATIINDGSATNGNRLILSSSKAGTAGAITLSSNLTGGTTPLPGYSDLQAAQDAKVVLGSGAGAITITKSSNTLSDVIPGATLNLVKESTTPVTITVSTNTKNAADAVQGFVDQYNQFHDYIKTATAFNNVTNVGGLLLGDYDTLAISDEVSNLLTGMVQGLSAGKSTLMDAGITLNGDGTLSLDQGKLTSALSADPQGTLRIFAASGQSSSANLEFVSASNKTRASGAGYDVFVTQAATKARVTAGVSMPVASAARVTAGVGMAGTLAANESLTINGVAVSLTAGMDRTAVLQQINAQSGATGVTASFTGGNGSGTGNYLTLTQKTTGSAPTITAQSSVSNLGGTSSGFGTAQVTAANPVGESGGSGAAGRAAQLNMNETLVVNGVAVSLTQGMSQSDILTAVNAVSDKTGVVATATDANGVGVGSYLTLTQKLYGSSNGITAFSSVSNQGVNSSGLGAKQVTGADPVGESGGTGLAGKDVAGTIGGEAATGNGQFLTGGSGNGYTDGLQVRVSGSTTGRLGTLSVTLGFGHAIATDLSSLTDNVSGRLKTIIDSYGSQSDELGTRIADKQAALTDKETTLRQQYARLESTISAIQTQGQRLYASLGLNSDGTSAKK